MATEIPQTPPVSATSLPRPPPAGNSNMSSTSSTPETKPTAAGGSQNYKGFVAGVFSGIAKLTVGHPFDTIKVRLQTTDSTRFSGPLQCVAQTIRNEGVRGLYKGATPPLVGWMFMDSIMMGSLTVYRRLLAEHVFLPPSPGGVVAGILPAAITEHPPSSRHPHQQQQPAPPPPPSSSSSPTAHLPAYGHGIAGILAGSTVSFIAAPVEHVKARLQIQYSANKADRLYSGPVDCLRKIYTHHGVRGVYTGLTATLLFRSFFFFWWSSYDVLSRYLSRNTSLSTPAINFWAGGLSAQVFWITSYPSDVVKQRIMTDPLGGKGLGDGDKRFHGWRDAARAVYREAGWRGYWRGFVPCFLRAFPANAMALVTFEGIMRTLP
ncbi:mitochondrial carrier domain-containing protein [Microdochium bolleyi]|uniref:Mitochondrial carrier domain-containing protein n=1 Tax=Microdochium bolleyi TaxID=196109 RepID=A0A136J1I2_9PEZI|nr:mitochondrial carrier domain-containing protein [Microdochium bolleyi]